jgi:putative addiction module component
MSKAFDEIAKEAIELSREQRNNLVSLLLQLNEDSPDEGVNAAWEREIMERIRAVDDGELEGISFEDVMRDAEGRLMS